MQNISLNSTLLSWHAQNSRILGKTERRKRDLKHMCSLFLSQSGDNLIYETMNGHMVIYASEKVDFQLPYPLVINLSAIDGNRNTDFRTRHDVIIPECTMANLQTYHDNNRPDWIRAEDDLKTNVIKVGNKKTNLEYIPHKSTPKFFNEVLQNPITDWQEWDWNPDADRLDKDKFGYDARIPAQILSGYSTFEPRLMNYAQLGLKYHTIYSDVYEWDEDRETSDKNTYYKIPVAIWNRNFKDFNINVRIAMIGKWQEYLLNER